MHTTEVEIRIGAARGYTKKHRQESMQSRENESTRR